MAGSNNAYHIYHVIFYLYSYQDKEDLPSGLYSKFNHDNVAENGIYWTFSVDYTFPTYVSYFKKFSLHEA